jgi:hypothetical protein
MRTARGSDGDRRVFATLGFDESQMRGARILFPGAVLSGYDEDLIQVNPASLTHFDAVLTTESGYAAWLNAFPELMSHWRAEERGEFVTLHRIGARTELRASDLQVTSNEPEAPYFALRLRPPMLFFAAEIEALRGDEPLERVVHRSLIAPGRSYQAFLSEAGALIIPWNGWEDDLRVRIVPAPQRLVYSERLYERLAPEE